jgi:hypothetical protein
MTMLELQLDDDLQSFVMRQSRALGYASAAAYVESLLAMERLRSRSGLVNSLLQAASDDPATHPMDHDYWQRLEAEVCGGNVADEMP